MRQLVVVQGHVTQQGLLHILTAVEPVGLQNVRYATVEALHHAVGSRGSWLGQPVLDPQLLAQLVQLMVAAGLALAAGKQAVRELLAVVGQQLGDPDRTGLVQCLEEGLCTGGCLVGLELHKHPACSPVNGHEQVAPAALVLHLGQVLHVHVHIARLVALERLVHRLWLLGLEGVEIARSMAAQAPIQTRARDMGTNELSGDRQQVIQGQQQGAPQVNHYGLLRWREHGLQAVGRVRAVAKDRALLPLVDRLLGDAKALGQHRGGLTAGRNLGTHCRRGAGVLVQGNQHDFTPRVDCKDSINSCRTARAMKRG